MKLPLLLLLLAATIHTIACFQSDELPEDDEEWGLVGGTSSSKIRAEKPEKEYTGSGNPNSRRIPSAASVSGPASDGIGDKKIQFTLEHSLGVGAEFVPAGLFSARLRASAHGRQVWKCSQFCGSDCRATQVTKSVCPIWLLQAMWVCLHQSKCECLKI